MSIEAIASITTMTATNPITDMGGSKQLDFIDFLQAEVQQAESKVQSAESELRALATGETDNLHQVMMSMSKAQTAFELVVEVRNKILEGYQEVMRTQI